MVSNDIIRELNKAEDPAACRQLLIDYLRHIAVDMTQDENIYDGAYKIAGLMSTCYMKTLKSDDPLDQIVVIAGELEARPRNTVELVHELFSRIDKVS